MEKTLLRTDMTNKVIDLIFSSLNLKHITRNDVNESTALVKEGLKLDSIDVLELVVNFEKAFQIKMDETESYAQHFRNIGTVVDFIEQKAKIGRQPQAQATV